MLSKDEIIKLVENPTSTNFVKLRYGFIRTNKDYRLVENNTDVLNEEEKSFFRKNLRDNRLVLTVGSIGKVITRSSVPKKMQYGEFPDIFDLQRDKGKYYLKPNESITVFTNEWFQLDNSTTLLVFSKVSNYIDGIIVTPSFVDSQWKGLIQLVITNNSSEYRSVEIGSEIASAFFIKLSGNLVPLGNDNALKAKHYKTYWENLLNNNEDPFQHKRTEPDAPQKTFIRKLFKNENFKKGLKYIGSVFTVTMLITAGKFLYNIHQQISSYEKDKIKITSIDSLRNEIIKLNSLSIETNEITLFLEKGKDMVSNSAFTKKTKDNFSLIIYRVSPESFSQLVKTNFSKKPNGTDINFSVILKTQALKSQEIKIEYFLAPK